MLYNAIVQNAKREDTKYKKIKTYKTAIHKKKLKVVVCSVPLFYLFCATYK